MPLVLQSGLSLLCVFTQYGTAHRIVGRGTVPRRVFDVSELLLSCRQNIGNLTRLQGIVGEDVTKMWRSKGRSGGSKKESVWESECRDSQVSASEDPLNFS